MAGRIGQDRRQQPESTVGLRLRPASGTAINASRRIGREDLAHAGAGDPLNVAAEPTIVVRVRGQVSRDEESGRRVVGDEAVGRAPD